MGYERNQKVGAKMNAKELVEKLNGCEIGNETTKEIESIAKENGLVIVFGASDDLMEFRGAINEELGAYNGAKVKLNADGLLLNKCDSDDDCPYFAKLMMESTHSIEALWVNDNIAWTYKTDLPHETFDVIEDDEIYCRGIIFSLKDLKP